jgi:flagellar M-ring protein FliF
MADENQLAASPFSVQGFNQLPGRQKLAAMLLSALFIAILVGVWSWSRSLDYSVLFANVSERDGGEIIAALQQMNIPYKVSEGGSAILVSASQVHETRLKLASQGLPKGGLVGFEVMETQKLGASQFLEQVNYQRALEGELARSIQSLSAVRGARVHLAVPKQSAFLRDEQKPSASVLINLSPGRVLEASQIAGIVHLVSSSVPELTPSNVAVIDQNGNLLSQTQDPSREAGLDPSQLKYVREVETSYIKRIEAILEPLAGRGNVRAQVAADVDFSQIDQMAETYKPNPAADAAVRSQQTSESGTSIPNATGVPGALSNQPPVPATAPITTPSGAARPGAPAVAQGQPINSSKNATTNYELDKTVRHTKSATGTVKRLSVAVVVNNKTSAPDKDGKVKSTPWSAAELKQINDLVHEAMGFTAARGDTVNIANVSFSAGHSDKEVIPDIPMWKDPEIVGMAREAIKYFVLAFVALLLWRRAVKPLLLQLMQQPAMNPALAAQMATEPGGESRQEQMQHMAYDSKLANARGLAREDPKMVANVIKGWVAGNE